MKTGNAHCQQAVRATQWAQTEERKQRRKRRCQRPVIVLCSPQRPRSEHGAAGVRYRAAPPLVERDISPSPPNPHPKPPRHAPMPRSTTYRVLSVLSMGGSLGAGNTACAAVGTPTPSASASTAAAAAERSAAPRDGGGAAAMDGRAAAEAAAAGRRPPPRVSRGAATKAIATAGEGGERAHRREGGEVGRAVRERREAGRTAGARVVTARAREG